MPTQGVEKGYRKKESANALLERALEQARAAEAASRCFCRICQNRARCNYECGNYFCDYCDDYPYCLQAQSNPGE